MHPAVDYILRFLVAISKVDDSFDVCLTSNNGSLANVCNTPGCVQAANILLESINQNVDPCDNFYEYSCGKWIKESFIPDDRSSYTRFSELDEELNKKLRYVLQQPGDSKEAYSRKLAKTYYKSCLDLDARNRVGSAELIKQLKSVGNWPLAVGGVTVDGFKFDLDSFQLKLISVFSDPVLVPFGVSVDDKNSTRHITRFVETPITIAREKYLNNTQYAKYQTYMKSLIKSLANQIADDMNVSPPLNQDKQIDELFAFEKRIAEMTASLAQRRNVTARYNVRTIAELQKMVPMINLTAMISAVYTNKTVNSLFKPDYQVILSNTTFYQNVFKLVNATEQRTVVNYLIWQSVKGFTKDLNDKYESIWNEYTQNTTGRAQKPARWKKCAKTTHSIFKKAVGAMFVDEYFNDAAKDNTLELIRQLKSAYREMIKNLSWMDETTKAYALQKLNKILNHIGYPSYIKDPILLDEKYIGLNFTKENSLYEMNSIIQNWAYDKDGRELLKPYNRTEFEGAYAVVNAFYYPSQNSINFPAGILQPPFFQRDFPAVMNLGGIGVVIGHEITHGFDDQGNQYDENGNLYNWWSNSSLKAFGKKAQCIDDQYSDYVVPQINKNINGKLTLGENIADNGGLRMAYEALRTGLSIEKSRLPGLQHLSAEQLFFISWANVWCMKGTDEFFEQRVLTDYHSPGMFRVIGTVANMPEFSTAFSCKPGSKMNPRKKCQVW